MTKKFGLISLTIILVLGAFPARAFQDHEHNQDQSARNRHRDRWYWQMPHRIMDELGIKAGMTVADVGGGDGYFTFFLSERVDKTGHVYVNDIDNEALQIIRDRCRNDAIKNVTVILGKEDDPLLPEKCLDVILMVNVIHLINDPDTFLHNIAKGLNPDGRLVIVQWDASKMDPEMPGWEAKNRSLFTLQTNLRSIYRAGYEVIEIKNFLPMQNIYICRPIEL